MCIIMHLLHIGHGDLLGIGMITIGIATIGILLIGIIITGIIIIGTGIIGMPVIILHTLATAITGDQHTLYTGMFLLMAELLVMNVRLRRYQPITERRPMIVVEKLYVTSSVLVEL